MQKGPNDALGGVGGLGGSNQQRPQRPRTTRPGPTRSRRQTTWMRRRRTFFNVVSSPHRYSLPEYGGLPALAKRGAGGDPWGGGNAATPPSVVPVTPRAGDGGNGSGSSTGTPPPPAGRPQRPDVVPGRRVSVHSQSTRAPRGEAMAPSPLCGGKSPRGSHGAPRRSGALVVVQGAQPLRHCGRPSHRA